MATQKRAIRVVATGARLLVGAAVAVGCVIGVTAAVAAPWPTLANEPAQVEVTPSTADSTLVCTGDFRALGRNTQDAAEMSSAGSSRLTLDSSGPREESTLTASDMPDGFTGPQRIIASAEQNSATLVGAADSIELTAEDLTGLAASACREPSTESWLVGGSVETGTNDIIILSNPGSVTATATLTVFGHEESASTMLVPAETQVAVPLASIAAGMDGPVVRITAKGAPVRAVMQSSLIRTLDPTGVDLQDTAGTPSMSLVFAGVQVLEESDETALTVMRLMATDTDTVASVTVSGDGEEARRRTISLGAGTPVELELEDLEPGVHVVTVEAYGSITGAIRQTTRVGVGSDFAWMTPAPVIAGETLIAVPEGPDPRIHLVNPTAEDISASLAPTNGAAAEEIIVPGGGSVVVDVADERVYALAGDGTLHAAVIMSGTDAIAGWPVWPAASAQDPITVYP
ncbi:DUF5719 family protein [Microbacterium sp. GXF6406]